MRSPIPFDAHNFCRRRRAPSSPPRPARVARRRRRDAGEEDALAAGFDRFRLPLPAVRGHARHALARRPRRRAVRRRRVLALVEPRRPVVRRAAGADVARRAQEHGDEPRQPERRLQRDARRRGATARLRRRERPARALSLRRAALFAGVRLQQRRHEHAGERDPRLTRHPAGRRIRLRRRRLVACCLDLLLRRAARPRPASSSRPHPSPEAEPHPSA